MGIGAPSLSTNQKRDTTGGAGITATAEGIGENPAGTAVLGREYGTVGPDASDCTTVREILMGDNAGTAYGLSLLGGDNGGIRTEIFLDPTGQIILQNQQSIWSRVQLMFVSLDLNVISYIYFEDLNNVFAIECGSENAAIYFNPDSGFISVGQKWDPPNTKFYVDGNVWVRDDLRAKFAVVNDNTGAVNLTADQSREIFTNTNTPGGGFQFNLPLNPVQGTEFTFVVTVSDPLLITAQPGDTIIYGPLETAAGGTIQSAARGSVLRVVLVEASTWYVISAVGSWNF